jgi:exoribonuclease R
MIVLNHKVMGLAKQEKNRATELIEDFMIAANGTVARLLLGVFHPARAGCTSQPTTCYETE